jgi:hypothetical protein
MEFIDLPVSAPNSISAFRLSRYGVKELTGSRLPTGLPVDLSRRASPLLAGLLLGLLPKGASWYLPDKEFRWELLPVPPFAERRDGHFCRPPYVAAGPGPSLPLPFNPRRGPAYGL